MGSLSTAELQVRRSDIATTKGSRDICDTQDPRAEKPGCPLGVNVGAPLGSTWVPSDIHAAAQHTGGVSVARGNEGSTT